MFKTDLECRYISRGVWELIAPLEYLALDGEVIIVPTGFTTDGASIPCWAWWLIGTPWNGKYSKGAVIHDFLCMSALVTRERADMVFLECMKELGVSEWRRSLMYFAVRVASGFTR